MFLRQIAQRVAARMMSTIPQGVKGEVALITGDFRYFTKPEAQTIESTLKEGKAAYVIVYDKDSIAVPANERAGWIRRHFKNHPALEVRVSYNPPVELADYASYIKNQLPNSIKVASVRCKNPYSQLLADELAVPLLNTTDINFKELDERIKRNPASHATWIMPVAIPRVISPFEKIIDPEAFNERIESEKAKVHADMLRLNPAHPNRNNFFTLTPWDTKALNRVNWPFVIGTITNPEERKSFSDPGNAQVFDMPIYIPGQGWKIPTELTPYQKLLAKIVAAEWIANPWIARRNVYLTIDNGIVPPNGLARRGGKHIDGFLTNANALGNKPLFGDNTYIMSDDPELQTEFYPGPFNLSGVNLNDPRAVLQAFEKQGEGMSYKQYNPYDIVRLNTNNVHAVHPNATGLYLPRSFIKVTFSERLFNRSGNTINPNLNYRLAYVPRDAGRNTQNFIGVVPAGFNEVDLKDINFKGSSLPTWLSSPFKISKNPECCITATPAIEGEILTTVVNEHEVTTNIARAGDMKVSRTPQDSYFLGANFGFLYKPTGDENKFKPIPRSLLAATTQRNISFLASWGTRQNIPAGGVIVYDPQTNDIWGVHEESFATTYI